MSLASVADRSILYLDRFLGKLQVRCCERQGCLLTVFFHSLFFDETEIQRAGSDPQQGVTVRHFARFIEYFRNVGYQFVSPEDVVRGLDRRGRHVLITFDDGYFNNHRALPVLEAFDVTATFFICAGYVKSGQAFWWDVLYRAGRAAGRSGEAIHRQFADLNRMTTENVEAFVRAQLGTASFAPTSDVDRPFTPAELRDFARSKHVFIGNHTCNHAILGNYTLDGVRAEIAGAQGLLEDMTGMKPLAIAYPNGDCNRDIARIAAECGLKLGFTTAARKDYVSGILRGDRALGLGRLCVWGNDALPEQCEYFRSDLALYERYQQLKKSLKALLRRQT
jgi:peptidoglycan/xylan/chitin deacetylase (PgdA/CDA1 family)